MLDFETQTVDRMSTMVVGDAMFSIWGTTLTERATTKAAGRIR